MIPAPTITTEAWSRMRGTYYGAPCPPTLPYHPGARRLAGGEERAMLAGRMMDFPLTLTHFLERAKAFYGRSEIVSRRVDRSLDRISYADFYRRTAKLAGALTRL